MLLIWGVLLANLIFPFPDKIATVFQLLLAFIFVIHLIQLLIVHFAFSKNLKLTKSENWQIFIFGIFKLWQIKTRLL